MESGWNLIKMGILLHIWWIMKHSIVKSQNKTGQAKNTIKDVLNLSQVCKKFRGLVSDNWEHLPKGKLSRVSITRDDKV